MAISIVELLRDAGNIEQDSLAERFAARYAAEPDRGYGPAAHRTLREIGEGADWREISRDAFGGQGSLGNGGAMRVAPVGAYFAEDLDLVAEQARLSAEVTHAHPEGIAGAIAVAVAAAVAARNQDSITPRIRGELLDEAIAHTPEGYTRTGLVKARELPPSYSVATAVSALGNGVRITAPDTVPFALWCAARHLDDFEEALWTTVSGAGDIDTNAAIVGGIVSCAVGRSGLPAEWLDRRETLPA
jgi:ADP-ribosylglycohydrolase